MPCHVMPSPATPCRPLPSHLIPSRPIHGRQSATTLLVLSKKTRGRKCNPCNGLSRWPAPPMRRILWHSQSPVSFSKATSHSAESTSCSPFAASMGDHGLNGCWGICPYPRGACLQCTMPEGYGTSSLFKSTSIWSGASALSILATIFPEPRRADFLISSSRRPRLIVDLEPGPFEVQGCGCPPLAPRAPWKREGGRRGRG